MHDIRINDLANKTILYDRTVNGHYGTGGIPIRPFINSKFAPQIEDCFVEIIAKLKKDAGLTVDKILTGGVSRSGGGSSLHHQNRAFDLDAFLFADDTNWVADTFPSRPQLYIGIEAILRKHFGTVLSYDYNRAHQDHFHFDNGTTVKFKTAAKSHVIFVQNASTLVYQTPIGRDGVWGPQTQNALKNLRTEMGIGALSKVENWRAFLDQVAKDSMEAEKGFIGHCDKHEEHFCPCCGQHLP